MSLQAELCLYGHGTGRGTAYGMTCPCIRPQTSATADIQISSSTRSCITFVGLMSSEKHDRVFPAHIHAMLNTGDLSALRY